MAHYLIFYSFASTFDHNTYCPCHDSAVVRGPAVPRTSSPRTGYPPAPRTILQLSFKVEVLVDHGDMELK